MFSHAAENLYQGKTTKMSEEYEFALAKSVPLAPPSEDLRPFMERKFRTLFR